jgi:hypothetical protein
LNSNKVKAADEKSLQSLKKGRTTKLVLPTKIKQALEDALSAGGRYPGDGDLRRYLTQQGHTFSFGTVSEESYPSDPDDDKSPRVLRYEFAPINLLLTFPHRGQLEDLFMCLHRNHPLYNDEFDCDEGFGRLSVISFQSAGDEEDTLRQWMAGTFLPIIWPDLLREATRIVEEKKAVAIAASPDGSFEELLVEHHRGQLCDDGVELTFHVG